MNRFVKTCVVTFSYQSIHGNVNAVKNIQTDLHVTKYEGM